MRRLSLFSALLLALNLLANFASAQNGATTTVTANPATITAGSSVGFTATVQPNNVALSPGHAFTKPSGTITFLDGSTSLDNTPLPLAPNTFAGATFQQAFGTPDSSIAQNVQGGLTGDLNGDGVADLLVYYDQTYTALLVQTFTSNSKGGYTTGALETFPTVGSGVAYPSVTNVPALIDVNGDGKLDLLFGIQVAYGNGDGTFAAPVPVSFLAGGFVTAYAADLNGDGKTDILAVNASSYPALQFSVTVFLNGGGGSFTSAGTVPIGSGGFENIFVYQPTFVDLNGDGKLDVVLQWSPVLQSLPIVSVLLNNGNGTFASPTQINVPYPPNIGESAFSYQTGYGDLNGDGKQDLILGLCDYYGNCDAIILLGNGDGTFESPTFFALPTPPNVIVPPIPNFIVQDVNLDGKLDLVFGSGRLALGNGDGTFTLGTPLFPLPANNALGYPLVQMDLPGNSVPSLVFLPLPVTPPPAAVFTPQTSSSASLSLTTLSVGAHTISARYSGDANYAADNSATVVVTVNQAASATAVTSSVNPSFAGQSVTLTAHVTSSGPTPTGNVVFSGSTTLGTVALTGGTAAYTTSSFDTAGAQTITAAYSGDANTQASSAQLSLVVDAAFTLAPGGSGSTTLTVNGGQTVTAPINVTGEAGFSGQVTFACSGLPANASCSFSPATINLSGTPAVSTLLTLNTAATTTTSQLRLGLGAYGLAFAGLVLLWPARHRGARICGMLFCAIGFATLGLNGCSGGSGSAPPAHTAAGTYSFTVVASSGGVKTQSAYTLVVQ